MKWGWMGTLTNCMLHFQCVNLKFPTMNEFSLTLTPREIIFFIWCRIKWFVFIF